MTLVIAVTALPVGMYVLLSTPWAHEYLRKIARDELVRTLGTRVEIGRVDFAPFNRLRVSDIAVADDNDSLAVKADNISARFEMMHLLSTGHIVIDYVAIDSLDAHLYRDSTHSPINVDRIIRRLTQKKPDRKATRFCLAVNTVLIGGSSVSYDVLDKPRRSTGAFDPWHIAITDLNMGASLPSLRNDSIAVKLDQLSLRERSGLELKSVRCDVTYTPRQLCIRDMEMLLPDSRLAFSDIDIPYRTPAEIGKVLRDTPRRISTRGLCYLSPRDLAPFVSVLSKVPGRMYLNIDVTADSHDIDIHTFKAANRQTGLMIDMSGSVTDFDRTDHPHDMGINALTINLYAQRGSLDWIAGLLPGDKATTASNLLNQLGTIKTDLCVKGTLAGFDAVAGISTAAGDLTASVRGGLSGKRWTLGGDFNGNNLQPSVLNGSPQLQRLQALSLDGDFDGSFGGGTLPLGTVRADISHAIWDGNAFRNIHGELTLDHERQFRGALAMAADSLLNGAADIIFEGTYGKEEPRLKLSGNVSELAIGHLGVQGKYSTYRLTADVDVDLRGTVSQWINGYAEIRDLRFYGDGPGLKINRFRADADNVHTPNIVTVESDFVNGRLQGIINLSTIAGQAMEMAASAMPVLKGTNVAAHPGQTHDGNDKNRQAKSGDIHLIDNNFNFEFKIADAENLSDFLELPVGIIYPVSIEGAFNTTEGTANVSIDAPYLQQNDKIIENTTLQADLTRHDGRGEVYLTTTYPTQKGVMNLVSGITASANRIDTKIDWQIEREKPINGLLSFSTLVGRDNNGHLNADIAVNPGSITFGNAEWKLTPSRIFLSENEIDVDHLALVTAGQAVRINGTASNGSDSELHLQLDNVELINIFRALDINNALIGGRASGTFNARELFSKSPALWCDSLFVRNIGYNDCIMGDGLVKARFEPQRGAFSLDAAITGDSGRKSYIRGDIFTAGALDIAFDADHIPVGFMKPFMSAFAEDLSGRASGHARLFGTFHDIDLEGDIHADSLGLKLGFTNTWYYATDSVHIRPGVIDLRNITLSDRYGNTALLNGYVRHKCFHLPDFEFRVTRAQKLLVYDVPSRLSPDWYGRVFGNGSAFVTGKPGFVNIDVNMSTTDGSVFTFVLSDNEEADDYTFISFRDKTPHTVRDSIMEAADSLPAAVREYRERMLAKAASHDRPTDYNMNIQVDINPAARIILVMDPVGGDEIKANGKGNLRMTYNNTGNELHMYGTYTIDHGSYNFTLQDIIRKDFTINSGSSITFTGDPYAAQLDITASYNVNANLSDLDENFLQDKDLNRTNVPVSAILMARGDMRQPEIKFDLAFPTLNSDVYRKVRSIVSTDDMMNRQIIYLLALNRFYTPDYMSTTKGNELFSVASSTIASQLSGMLGKLSENWSIAPNLRSDRGDFSDVEVDVALSSSLLNNRLLFNGNFGYRDKSLNTNQFIGDFDIEYLLNSRGTWRLKAYNRYNDQNYYLRTAQTTQGVGIMFRRDFDNMFNFLKPRASGTKADTIDTVRPPAPRDTTPAGTPILFRAGTPENKR